MDNMGYVFLAWGLTFAGLGGYALWVIRKGKKITPQVPSEERRWS